MISFEMISSATNRGKSHHSGCADVRLSRCAGRHLSYARTVHSSRSAGLRDARNRPMSWDSWRRCAAVSRNRCNGYSSSRSLRCGLVAMAGPAQAFEVRIVIGTPTSLSLDVVNRLCGDGSPTAKAVLTQMIVARQNARTPDVPLTTVTAFVSALALLVLQPSLIAMLLTISRTVSGSARAYTLTAGAGD
nr:MAG TPA_asm: hypothetical protein [Caudoviricetes sp.]